jgi:hypothetical protein
MTSAATRELELLTLEEPSVNAMFTYGRFAADETQAEPATLDVRDPLRFVQLTVSVPNVRLSAAPAPQTIVSEHDFLGGEEEYRARAGERNRRLNRRDNIRKGRGRCGERKSGDSA